MIQQFTTKRDVMAAFSYAMNLISPEVENHHEKVAYIAGQIAKISTRPKGRHVRG